MRLRLVTLLVALAATAACTPDDVAMLPEPPPLPATTTTTAPPDHSQTDLRGVAGRTTTTIAIGPGSAAISGTVTGPDGPVPGAVVRAERLVGEAIASVDQVAQPDGSFAVPAILGGRYRVRAWKPDPDNLATLEPQVFFLGGTENKVLEIRLNYYQGPVISTAVAPDPPTVGRSTTLVVQVGNQTVDQNGIVRTVPVTSVRAELFGAGDWEVQSVNPTVTDGTGQARWFVRCRRPGTQPLSVVVGDSAAYPLNVPPCAAASPGDDDPSTTVAPTTTTEPAPTTTRPRVTTTTSRPTTTAPRPSTTTSTTRR